MIEFKKICDHIAGKPKTVAGQVIPYYSIAHYSDYVWNRQALLIFDNLPEKRQFLNLFKLLYPDYWVQEISKTVKFFIMSTDEQDSQSNWKEFFERRYDSKVKNVQVTSGQEGLASDYKLLKHPVGQLMVGLRVIVAEFSNASDALDAFFQLNDASIQHENSPSVRLIGMFEPDDESKNYVIDKKEQQKLDDEFDKLDKIVDKYLT